MTEKKTSIIFGITGQDGSYMANLLLKKKYQVIGFTRSLSKKNLSKFLKINKYNDIKLYKYNEYKISNVIKILKKIYPDEIYYFSGQSSVAKSFEKPLETYKSNIYLLFEILNFIKENKLKTKLYNSSSTDCFGNGLPIKKKEQMNFKPISPYGKSKAFSFWMTKYFREYYSLRSKSGILSNHESPLRDNKFVIKKIIQFVKNFNKNTKKKLKLGRVDISRDWGWAPEYVDAIYKINTSKFNEDYIVGTGKNASLFKIVKIAFKIKNININFLKKNNSSSLRSNEIKSVGTFPLKINKQLKWKAKNNISDVIKKIYHNNFF